MLKTLEEHNAERSALYRKRDEEARYGRASGIACPKCGKELRENVTMVLTSHPPQHHVWCSDDACRYKGYCIA